MTFQPKLTVRKDFSGTSGHERTGKGRGRGGENKRKQEHELSLLGARATDSHEVHLTLAPTVQRVRRRQGTCTDPVTRPEHNPRPTTPHPAGSSRLSELLSHLSHALLGTFPTHRVSVNLGKSYLRLSLNQKLLQPMTAVSCPLGQGTGSLVSPQRCPTILPHILYSFSNLSFEIFLLQEAGVS